MMKMFMLDILNLDVEFDVNFEVKYGQVYVWIGGVMDNLDYLLVDLIFYMYYCFVDVIWEQFRDNQVKCGMDLIFYFDVIEGYVVNKLMKFFYLEVKNGKKIYLKNKDGYVLKWFQLV